MYNITRNNYHKNPKNSSIQTPPQVSLFIFELLKDKVDKKGIIFDPCCGIRNLLEPWEKNGYPTYGIDIDQNVPADKHWDFLKDESQGFKLIQIWGYSYQRSIIKDSSGVYPNSLCLILCNPPFNSYGNKLGSEVWLDKIIELFGKEVPIILFAPVGFRVNLTLESKRWGKFKSDYPPVSSIITLPKNIFEGVIFHSEILIFNIKDLEPHYFYQPTREPLSKVSQEKTPY